MAKLKMQLTSDREISVSVDGVPVGKITIALQEQETIPGIDNAIVVLGDCENLQDHSHNGFSFVVVKNVIKPESAAIASEGESV
jgi:hypothetical protein